ncbi:MAG TPA: polysaccharide deacetylase family protein [Chitinophagaceae bacterium]|nr:polysaccharide deacetylase family protein [Chitinophagaceae bacterium]
MASLVSGWGARIFQAWDGLQAAFQSGAIILLYHRTAVLARDPQQLAVTPDRFNDQVEILKAHYRIAGVEEFTHHLVNRQNFPKGTVLITFDDGYLDNLTEALPILESAGAQALFYITTSKLGSGQELWWDGLERILLGDQSIPGQLNLTLDGSSLSFSTGTPGERSETYRRLQSLLQYQAPRSVEDTMEQMFQWSGTAPTAREDHRLMDPGEVTRMAKSPAAVIGCHTHRHPALGMLPSEIQREEITQSRRILAELTGNPVRHFSYPFGSRKFLGPNRCYTNQTVEICKELGFEMVTANYPGMVHSWSPRFALPRHSVRNWDRDQFQDRLRSFFHR